MEKPYFVDENGEHFTSRNLEYCSIAIKGKCQYKSCDDVTTRTRHR
jgi:hypothetical protein